jgi:hypothetical protein
MQIARPHRLKPRPGKWVRRSTGGLGGLTCDVHGYRTTAPGWGFLDAGQITTTSAFVCDDCAAKIGLK